MSDERRLEEEISRAVQGQLGILSIDQQRGANTKSNHAAGIENSKHKLKPINITNQVCITNDSLRPEWCFIEILDRGI